jgi:hypothetical protein
MTAIASNSRMSFFAFLVLPDSIIIGTLPGETCSDSQPSWTPGSSSIQLTEPSFGVMMSSFNQARSKLDGTAQWHLSKTKFFIFPIFQLAIVRL